jgi:hypothetical protein
MKAKYILEALEAMKQAEDLLDNLGFEPDPVLRGNISWRLTHARIQLKVYSGVNDLELSVEG